MIKFVVLVNLREGIDPDNFWKFWEKVHAPPHLTPGLIKYCINRVTKVIDGEVKYWGMAEQWFESEDALHNMLNSPGLLQAIENEKRQAQGSFRDQTIDQMVVVMEEKTIVENGVLIKED